MGTVRQDRMCTCEARLTLNEEIVHIYAGHLGPRDDCHFALRTLASAKTVQLPPIGIRATHCS